MTTEHMTPDGIEYEDGADEPHNEHTIKRVLQDAFAYCVTGRKLWVNPIDRNGRGGRRER